MGRRWQSNRNDAGSLLASTFITSLATGFSIFVLIAIYPRENVNQILIICGACVALLIGIIWMRFGRMPLGSLSFWAVFGRSHREDHMAGDYVPRKVSDGRSTLPPSGQKPITADEVRDIQSTSANTWVPAKTRRSS